MSLSVSLSLYQATCILKVISVCMRLADNGDEVFRGLWSEATDAVLIGLVAFVFSWFVFALLFYHLFLVRLLSSFDLLWFKHGPATINTSTHTEADTGSITLFAAAAAACCRCCCPFCSHWGVATLQRVDRGRDRERERDRQRETDRDRDRERDRATEREGRERERDRETERQRDRERERERDRQTETERQRETETERQRETEGTSRMGCRVAVVSLCLSQVATNQTTYEQIKSFLYTTNPWNLYGDTSAAAAAAVPLCFSSCCFCCCCCC